MQLNDTQRYDRTGMVNQDQKLLPNIESSLVLLINHFTLLQDEKYIYIKKKSLMPLQTHTHMANEYFILFHTLKTHKH